MVGTLNEEDQTVIDEALGQSKVHSSTVVRVYRGDGGQWKPAKVVGAVCLVTDANRVCIRVVDLTGRRGAVAFDQELYERFDYRECSDWFHCFAADDGSVLGLSFASSDEAADFSRAVKLMVPSGSGGSSSPTSAPVSRPPPSRPAAQKPSRPGPPPPPSGSHKTPPARDSAEPEAEPAAAAAAPPTKPSHPAAPPTETPAAAPQQQTPPKKETSTATKKKKGGFMGMLSSVFKGDSEPDTFEISAPENFRHQAHIGWDPTNGFDIRNIPPEWKKLFQAAGVKKSELNNPETCGVIMGIIQQHSGGGSEGSAPSAPSAPAPPPPPPSAGGAPPPPPPPPPPPGTKRALIATSAAPAGSADDGGETSSGNSGGGNSGGGNSALLQQIQGGIQLKKVDPSQAMQEKLPDLNSNEGQGLVGALRAAMDSRRFQIREEDAEDEDPNDAVWSD